MNKLLRRLPLPAKLILIGLMPLVFLVYLSFRFFNEKTKEVSLYKSYKTQINQSIKISTLIDYLQTERRYSFTYGLEKKYQQELLAQRPLTDAAINELAQNSDYELAHFRQYTFLDNLQGVRGKVDSGSVSPYLLMQYYTKAIVRLSTLNSVSIVNNNYLKPIYKDLIGQHILSQMATYLGIIRSNIYGSLSTRQFTLETLLGTKDLYETYQTFETEFFLKATPSALRSYQNVRSNSSLKPTIDYIDTVFKNLAFDTVYSAESWWSVSTTGMDNLRKVQRSLLNNVSTSIDSFYQRAQARKKQTLVLLILTLLFVFTIVTFVIISITKTLMELNEAAKKISKGASATRYKIVSQDVIGSLAESILEIDRTNKALADAADRIGKGDFSVAVEPRSKEDVLGNAIVEMRNDLQEFALDLQHAADELEQKVKERTKDLNEANAALLQSNEELEQFAYIASHDLQEPVRKIRIFCELIMERSYTELDKDAKVYFDKICTATERMLNIIKDILNFSHLERDDTKFKITDLNTVLKNVQEDLEHLISQKKATIVAAALPRIEANAGQMNQLFYNLVHNAIKFSREDKPPVIELNTRKLESNEFPHYPNLNPAVTYFEISFKDNGIGFNQNYAYKIFTMFQRLNHSKDYSGTGIGLAICKKIVVNHKGYITVDSKVDEGSTFRIILPEFQSEPV